MSKLHNYKIYATLLDAYTGYINSREVWETYWGFSENPPHTPDEFEELQKAELINRINRVPFTSWDADRGTIFNELVDSYVEGREPNSEYIVTHEEDKKGALFVRVKWHDMEFLFPMAIIYEFYKMYMEDTMCQVRTEATLPTQYGDVLLYGYIDELAPFVVHDIKCTKKYSLGKFKEHWQHIVYPYCLQSQGMDISRFDYDITDMKGIWHETYCYDAERDVPRLRECVEGLIEFLEENRDKITDKKIFAEDADS